MAKSGDGTRLGGRFPPLHPSIIALTSGEPAWPRHAFPAPVRPAEATRRAVRAWGLEILCADPEEHSSSLTAVLMPEGYDADDLRGVILENFNMSLGTGLGNVTGKRFG